MARLQSGCPRLAKPSMPLLRSLKCVCRAACYKYVAPTGASPSGPRALEDPCKEQGKRSATPLWLGQLRPSWTSQAAESAVAACTYPGSCLFMGPWPERCLIPAFSSR